jgi:hypothetical protein
MAKAKLTEGTRVLAPHPQDEDRMHKGTITDDLSVMYFIEFDDGTEDFVFKARDIKTLE